MVSYLRYKQELRTVQDADDIESWITVRGNHIPIKKGQSKEEAVKEFVESKGSSFREVIKPDIEKKGSVSIVSKGSNKSKYKIGETVKQGKIVGVQQAKLSDTPYYQIEKKDGKKEWLIEEEVKPESSLSKKPESSNNKTIRGKTRFGNHMGKLVTSVNSIAQPESIVVNCVGEDKKFSWNNVKEAIKYAESVDDVTGIKIYGKEGKSLGWFGIEPANSSGDIFDTIYDYTDNDFCDKVMNNLKQGSSENKESKNDYKYIYQMLDRLRTDNDYYLGNGGRADKHLWAGNPKDQIAEMRKLYNSLPADKKPEWLTEKDINKYEKQMVGNKESSKKWSGAWSKRANKPESLGNAAKNATSISKMTKMSASERDENVGFPMLEIAYGDVKFTSDPEKNRSALSKAIKESKHENADLMQTVLSNLSGKELKDADAVRKGVRDYMKAYNKKKTTDSWHKLWGKK